MLTSAEKTLLVKQLKMIFQQFVDTDQEQFVDAISKMALAAVQVVLDLEQALLDVGDDACCGRILSEQTPVPNHHANSSPRHGCPHS